MQDITKALQRLAWMRERHIWPDGLRYLWTDAFGLILLVSLYRKLNEQRWLDEAEELVAKVDRVLGRERGFRIGEAPDRDGQYFHYLAMWVHALGRLGAVRPAYRQQAIQIVKDIHPRFVVPEVGVIWKMQEDLSRSYPGHGLGALDPFHGLTVYRLLDPQELEHEIDEMKHLVERSWRTLRITQDLGLGVMLWLTHFFPGEEWAATQRSRSLAMLDHLWVEPPGYFAREPGLQDMKFAFTNYGISIGLQSVAAWEDRVKRMHAFFEDYRSGDEYDTNALTHVMAASAWYPGDLLAPPVADQDLRAHV